MVTSRSGVAVLNAYFGKMKVSEFKRLSREERQALADAAAADFGLKKVVKGTHGATISYEGELPEGYVIPEPLGIA